MKITFTLILFLSFTISNAQISSLDTSSTSLDSATLSGTGTGNPFGYKIDWEASTIGIYELAVCNGCRTVTVFGRMRERQYFRILPNGKEVPMFKGIYLNAHIMNFVQAKNF